MQIPHCSQNHFSFKGGTRSLGLPRTRKWRVLNRKSRPSLLLWMPGGLCALRCLQRGPRAGPREGRFPSVRPIPLSQPAGGKSEHWARSEQPCGRRVCRSVLRAARRKHRAPDRRNNRHSLLYRLDARCLKSRLGRAPGEGASSFLQLLGAPRVRWRWPHPSSLCLGGHVAIFSWRASASKIPSAYKDGSRQVRTHPNS